MYLKKKQELMNELNTSCNGLSSDQAAAILQEKGPNQLQEGKKKSTIEVFFSQFKDLLVIILIAAANVLLFVYDRLLVVLNVLYVKRYKNKVERILK